MDNVVPYREGGLLTFLSSGQVELLRVSSLSWSADRGADLVLHRRC